MIHSFTQISQFMLIALVDKT